MPAEKSSVSKSSENRRSNKPLMEKRRRARINQSLTELKSLILDAVKKDSSRHNKLEKADILEMTVKYLQNLQRQQLAANIVADPSVASKFRAGFGECTNEVSRFLEKSDNLETNVRSRLLGHLTSCLTGLEKDSSSSSGSTTSTEPTPSTSPCPNNAADNIPSSPVPNTVDLNNNNTNNNKTNQVPSMDTVFSGLQLIPTRLANGEIAFILPTHHALAAAQALSLGRLEQLAVSPRPASSPTLVAQVSPMSRSDQESPSKSEEDTSEPAKDDCQVPQETQVPQESQVPQQENVDKKEEGGDASSSLLSSSPPENDTQNEKTSRSDSESRPQQCPLSPLVIDKNVNVEALDEPVWRPW